MFGTCPPGVSLPSIDLDYYAICRHAVTKMIETGHRKLVYIPDLMLDKSLASGDIRSMEGFRDAIGSFSDPLITGKIVHFHNTRERAVDMLRHMFSDGNPPTGLLISNSYFFLLTLTYLQKSGIRVPGNVSLICRSDDLFLDYINPAPTKYKFMEQALSDPLLDFIVRIMEGRPIKDKVIRIMPDYQEGGTLGPPATM
jgi:DNA-binding LacI/PurR family transcriptional regulator